MTAWTSLSRGGARPAHASQRFSRASRERFPYGGPGPDPRSTGFGRCPEDLILHRRRVGPSPHRSPHQDNLQGPERHQFSMSVSPTMPSLRPARAPLVGGARTPRSAPSGGGLRLGRDRADRVPDPVTLAALAVVEPSAVGAWFPSRVVPARWRPVPCRSSRAGSSTASTGKGRRCRSPRCWRRRTPTPSWWCRTTCWFHEWYRPGTGPTDAVPVVVGGEVRGLAHGRDRHRAGASSPRPTGLGPPARVALRRGLREDHRARPPRHGERARRAGELRSASSPHRHGRDVPDPGHCGLREGSRATRVQAGQPGAATAASTPRCSA